ncbi:RNA-binding ATPase activator esf2 [Boothiomyces macroporosus]|uniref:18S rRNA factor 2 n=1 Tax=Boothiomyces macroporosus TaxID=261099 RepID=A0AAD5Y3A9_9FUNG|nr:RNA-binding ATPase activator esf2 [Boothiomyces macroporosus]
MDKEDFYDQQELELKSKAKKKDSRFTFDEDSDGFDSDEDAKFIQEAQNADSESDVDNPEHSDNEHFDNEHSDNEHSDNDNEDGLKENEKALKPLDDKSLKDFQARIEKTGVCYMSRIPPFMKHTKLRSMLTKYGEIGRIYLNPEDPRIAARRKKYKHNKRQNFVEGWIEFMDKKIARKVASLLNNTNMGGKKRGYYYDDIWNIKYLPKFKWHHLTEQLAYELKVKEQKIKTEMDQVKRENKMYLKNVEKAKMVEAIKQRKETKEPQKNASEKRKTEEEPKRKVKQRKDIDSDFESLPTKNSNDVIILDSDDDGFVNDKSKEDCSLTLPNQSSSPFSGAQSYQSKSPFQSRNTFQQSPNFDFDCWEGPNDFTDDFELDSLESSLKENDSRTISKHYDSRTRLNSNIDICRLSDSDDSDFESSINNSQPVLKSHQELLQKEQDLISKTDISKSIEKLQKRTERETIKKMERLERQLKREQERNIRLETKLKQKQLRDEEKETKKSEKQREKEALEMEQIGKKALQTANRLRQKIECTRELIVHLCTEWDEKDPYLKNSLEEVGVEIRKVAPKIRNSLSLTHKVDREYDFENGSWNPCNIRLERLPYTMILLSATEIAQILKKDNTLVKYFTDCTSEFQGNTIIFFVVGLPEYYRSYSSAEIAIRNDEIREQLTNERRKKRKTNDILDGPDKKTIERELILLQIYGKGKSEYNQLAFGDSIKSGKDVEDTWVKMIEKIPGITERMAIGISKKYPTLGKFLEQVKSFKDLAGIPYETASTGKEYRTGESVAKRLYTVFFAQDPNLPVIN